MKPTHLIIHHSATKDSGNLSWGAIRAFHLKKGWLDIGYHLGLEWVGTGYEMLMGRPFDMQGAHCYQQGMNRKSLGVCFVGDYDSKAPALDMLEYAAPRLLAICELAGIPVDLEHIRGHRDFAPKTCPGKLFSVETLVKMMELKGG